MHYVFSCTDLVACCHLDNARATHWQTIANPSCWLTTDFEEEELCIGHKTLCLGKYKSTAKHDGDMHAPTFGRQLAACFARLGRCYCCCFPMAALCWTLTTWAPFGTCHYAEYRLQHGSKWKCFDALHPMPRESSLWAGLKGMYLMAHKWKDQPPQLLIVCCCAANRHWPPLHHDEHPCWSARCTVPWQCTLQQLWTPAVPFKWSPVGVVARLTILGNGHMLPSKMCAACPKKGMRVDQYALYLRV